MQTEIEAKWLNINHDDMRAKLKSVGAKLVHAERQMTRRTFDLPDGTLEAKGAWVRVRDEGDKITMSYKQLNDRTLHGTKEATVGVSNFDEACVFLQSLGLIEKSYQETKRESWKIGDVEIELDTWPWIPSFIEIEAPGEATLKETAKLLSLDFSKALHGSVETAYQAVYDVTEEEIDNWETITFSPVPDWLQAKAKKQ